MSKSGAKLAPFNSGGVATIFPDIKKKGRNIFQDINQLN
jgi:hypothetical protein